MACFQSGLGRLGDDSAGISRREAHPIEPSFHLPQSPWMPDPQAWPEAEDRREMS